MSKQIRLYNAAPRVSLNELFKGPLMLMCIALIAMTGCSEAQDSQVEQAKELIEKVQDLDIEAANEKS